MKRSQNCDGRSVVLYPVIVGFTMIELLVTLTVIAVLSTIAIPYMRDIYIDNQVTGYTNDFVQTMYAARIEAVKRTQNVSVDILPPGNSSNEWGLGFSVQVVGGANIIKIFPKVAAPNIQTIDNEENFIAFQFKPNGGIDKVAGLTFHFCDSRIADRPATALKQDGRKVTINSRGQIRSEECSCDPETKQCEI